MGCAASSSTTSGGAAGAAAEPKYRFGATDLSALGASSDTTKATVRAVFESGRTTVFLAEVPADATVEAAPLPTGEESAAAAAAPPPATAHEAEESAAAAAAEGGEAAAAAAPEEAAKSVPRIKWAVYNDGKSEVRITATFFRADGLRVMDATAATEERAAEGGRLQVVLTVPPTSTRAFVEGPIGGYMWKCEVRNAEGGYDLARTYGQ